MRLATTTSLQPIQISASTQRASAKLAQEKMMELEPSSTTTATETAFVMTTKCLDAKKRTLATTTATQQIQTTAVFTLKESVNHAQVKQMDLEPSSTTMPTEMESVTT
tara:strand:+ start:508 stop:831 length:324 start_codon:yes stop_codon:yes gene_type:complete